MLKPLAAILPAILLLACSGNDRNVNIPEKLEDSASTVQAVVFADPQIIDSSQIVVYPLVFQSDYNDYGNSSKRARASYWNLVFYNTETGRQHLLTTDKKILIYSLDFGSGSSYSSGSTGSPSLNVFKEHILYTAVAKDYNANQQLDENDPTYLFASDREGNGFRQVSPEGYNILSWAVVPGTTRVILQGRKDDNGDKVFDNKDRLVPLIADLHLQQPATEAFGPAFTDSIRQKLISLWKP